MMPQQLIYKQIRHSPQRIMRQSNVLPIQQVRLTTPLRQQRSISYFDQSSSVKKHQENYEKENQYLQERVQQLKVQIQGLEKGNMSNQETEEQYIVALRVFQDLKIEAEQLKLELSYIKQENNLLKMHLKQMNF